MQILVAVILCAVLATELALVYELRETRKEMRMIREQIPRWVGISIAFNALTAAVKRFRE